MSANPLRRRPRRLNRERSVHLLACDFSVSADCEELFSELDGLVQHCSQRYPVSRRYRFEIWRTDGGYRLCEDGRDLDARPDARSAAVVLYARMQHLALDALSDFTKIHAGCADWQGKRLVVVGPARSGKTTLMTRLLYEGFAVHCDDLVLTRQGTVLPYPRLFWVRSHALALLPQIAEFAAKAPATQEHFAVSPSQLGFDWQIAPAPADTVIFLEPNHGGETRLDACPMYSMAERIMLQSNPPAAGIRDLLRDVCNVLQHAACFVLQCGALDAGSAAVKAALCARVSGIR